MFVCLFFSLLQFSQATQFDAKVPPNLKQIIECFFVVGVVSVASVDGFHRWNKFKKKSSERYFICNSVIITDMKEQKRIPSGH